MENSKKSPWFKGNISLLEFVVALFSVAIVVLAFIDDSFRDTFEKLATLVIGGFLGNKMPNK